MKLTPLLTDYAIVQRHQSIPVWGWTEKPRTRLRATLGPVRAEGISGDDARFLLRLPALPAGGPLYREHRREGNCIRILFDQASDGLSLRDGDSVRTLMIAGRNGEFMPAQSAIEGASLVVWNDEIPAPVAVRYAWADNPADANLIGTDGYPAGPFRTDVVREGI